MRNASLRTSEGAPRVDLVHAVKTLNGSGKRASKANRAGIVDQDINAAKSLDCFGHSRVDLIFKANVHRAGERLAAAFFHLSRGRVNRAFQLGMRLDRFRGNDNVGAIARRADTDRFTNASAGASNEQGLS